MVLGFGAQSDQRLMFLLVVTKSRIKNQHSCKLTKFWRQSFSVHKFVRPSVRRSFRNAKGKIWLPWKKDVWILFVMIPMTYARKISTLFYRLSVSHASKYVIFFKVSWFSWIFFCIFYLFFYIIRKINICSITHLVCLSIP